MTNRPWTEERDEVIRQRYLIDGASAAVVGRELGVTRNALIGRAHRIGIKRGTPSKPRETDNYPPRVSNVARRGERPPPKRYAKRSKPRPSIASAPMPTSETAVAFFHAKARQCKWCIEPFEAPAHAFMMVCGAAVEEGRPWCAHHDAKSRGAPTDHRTLKPPYEATVVRRAA